MKIEIPTSGYILYALSCILRFGFEGPRLSMSVGIIGLKATKEPLLRSTPCGCSPRKVTKRIKRSQESLFMFPYCTTQGKLLTMNEDSLDHRLFLSSCQSTVFGRSERWKCNRSWSIKSHKFPINHIHIIMFIHDMTPQRIP